ncbi:MAG TPA: hypothetical protein VGO64_01900 [Candidatus Limnocylindrales bacterium]|nr:hypothetical protein [Candidatus Limnocylindrales bacterium]
MTDRRPPAARRMGIDRRYEDSFGSDQGEPADAGRSISPTAVLIVIALVGSVAFLVYTFTVRDASQIPLLAAGAVVLGLVFTAIAVFGARAIWRSSIEGRDARAFGHAIVGGFAALAAAACFAAAVILFLLRQTPAG